MNKTVINGVENHTMTVLFILLVAINLLSQKTAMLVILHFGKQQTLFKRFNSDV